MDLREEIYFLKEEFNQIKEGFVEIYKILEKFKEDLDNLKEQVSFQNKTYNPQVPAEIKGSSTHPYHFKPLKGQNTGISIGNQGASTDRQTDRQTDQQTPNTFDFGQNTINFKENQEKNTIDSAAEIIESLDKIKRQIRLKFKQLTDQEMLVFSTIYQFDEEKGYSSYKSLSEKLNLTESSIRDYIGRLIKKGIPLNKIKQNNKEIQLEIPHNLKKIATLGTILKLREL